MSCCCVHGRRVISNPVTYADILMIVYVRMLPVILHTYTYADILMIVYVRMLPVILILVWLATYVSDPRKAKGMISGKLKSARQLII